jgi:hypothetical protein
MTGVAAAEEQHQNARKAIQKQDMSSQPRFRYCLEKIRHADLLVPDLEKIFTHQ